MLLPCRRTASALALILCLLCLPGILGAQENANTRLYRIESIDYVTEGRTIPFALEDRLVDLRVGREFATREELTLFVNEQQRQLNNLLQIESSEIDTTFQDRGGYIAVTIRVSTVDSSSIVAFPQPSFSTEEGWEISVKFRDYNFLGRLNTLGIDLFLILPNPGNDVVDQTAVSIQPRVSLPFSVGDTTIRWDSALNATLEVVTDGDITIDFDNTIGVDFDLGPTTWTASYLQGIGVDTDESDDLYILTSKLGVASNIVIPVTLGALGRWQYNPDLFTQVKYRFDQPVKADERGFEIGFNHSFTTTSVDWIDNIRTGLSTKLENRNIYNFYTGELDSSISAEIGGHTHTANLIAYSARAGALYYFPYQDSLNVNQVGNLARGVFDSSANGNAAAYINTDIKLVGFKNKNALEAQGGLFADFVFATDTSRAFDVTRDLNLGVGVELIGFLLFSRSLFIRLTVGYEVLSAIRAGEFAVDNQETFIQIGHFY